MSHFTAVQSRLEGASRLMVDNRDMPHMRHMMWGTPFPGSRSGDGSGRLLILVFALFVAVAGWAPQLTYAMDAATSDGERLAFVIGGSVLALGGTAFFVSARRDSLAWALFGVLPGIGLLLAVIVPALFERRRACEPDIRPKRH